MHRIKVLLFIIVLTGNFALSQSSLVLNNLPPTVKWYQLNTPHFKIIYPAGFSEQGQRVANTMEHIYEPVSQSLSVADAKKLPLILQNRTSISNGFVTLGPRRSEFYTMSPQRANLVGNNDWLEMLALHEYRHVVQYERARTGFTGFIRNIFGEYSLAAVASTSVPSWYWEGDAVGIETALSQSGRGRIPQFSAAFRANLLERGPYNYNKAYLQSFKDNIPNHYVLGYFYSTYLKNQYGNQALEKIVNRAWAYSFIPFTFSFAQKKYAGEKMPAMYLSMMDQLHEKWTDQQKSLSLTDFTVINTAPKKVYTNYNYPQVLDNGNLIVLKSGLSNYPTLVEINVETGDETKIHTPGVLNDAAMLSAQDGIVVWNEFNFDPRWRQRTYSVIKTYNLATNQLNKLTTKSRYSSASIAPDRLKIATVEETEDYQNKLAILDASTGAVLTTIPMQLGSSITNPVWSDETKIVFAEVIDRKKQIAEIDINTQQKTILLPPSDEHISYAFRRGEYLYYVSGVSEIDNIYVLDLSTGKKYQVTSSQFGAYNPVISRDGRYIYYNELNSMGNNVVRAENNIENWKALETVTDTDVKFYQPLIELEGNADILTTIPDNNYEEKRYHKKVAKFHSWGPYLANSINEMEAGLYSTNVLSTTDLFLGFNVDTDFNFKWIARTSYQGLYPIIDAEINYAKRNTRLNYRDTTDNNTTKVDQINWNEVGVKAGLRIPWLLTNGKFYTNLELRNYVGVTAVSNYESSAFGDDKYFLYFRQLGDGTLISNEFRLFFSTLHSRSKRDIQSKWGGLFLVESFGTPYGGDYAGGLTAFRAQLYVPGLAKHHSLNFFAGYQNINITLDDNNYWFPNRMPYPRGVLGSTFQQFYTFRSNYEFPLLYPDLGIGPWVYMQRIKANLFYDYGYGTTNVVNSQTSLQFQGSQRYESTGVELTFDFNVMRALPMLELGVRYAYVPATSTGVFEFLVGSFGF